MGREKKRKEKERWMWWKDKKKREKISNSFKKNVDVVVGQGYGEER